MISATILFVYNFSQLLQFLQTAALFTVSDDYCDILSP